MKRHLLLPALVALLAPCAAYADEAPAPEKLYLVGSFTQWQTPAENPGTQYYLSDPDGDGVYTGMFNLPGGEECAFQIFTACVGWEENSRYTFGFSAENYFYHPANLYDNVEFRTHLDSNADGGVNAIYIQNWRGGELSFEATLTDGGIDLSLKGEVQPNLSKFPELFLIGDFNDWTLPASADEFNGALPLYPDPEYGLPFYTGNIPFPAGDVNFTVACPSRPGSYSSFYVYGPDSSVPFILRNAEGYVTKCPNSLVRSSINKDYGKFRIEEWTGGELTITVRSDLWQSYLYSNTAPVLVPKTFYALVKTPELTELIDFNEWGYLFGLWQNAEILFTTERSLTPAPENIWGVRAEDTVFKQTDTTPLRFVQGGDPIKIDFRREGRVTMQLYQYLGQLVFGCVVDVVPADAEHLYLIGYQSDWMSPSASNAEFYKEFEFDMVRPGVFSKLVDCPYLEPDEYENRMQFRFMTDLIGWSSEWSLGSDLPDFYSVEADMQGDIYTGTICQHGLSNWALTNWPGGELMMYVDLNRMELTLVRPGSGVEAVEESADEADVRWYTLQSVPVANPGRGLYIKVTPKGTSKVLL